MIFAHGAEIGQLKTHLSEIQGICVKTASHRNKERARRSSLTSKARGEICSTRTGRELRALASAICRADRLYQLHMSRVAGCGVALPIGDRGVEDLLDPQPQPRERSARSQHP